ncbi:MAG: winged helix-turn-helix transcriptional regulator [Anaerolineales bacterium]|nr:winged helix-turn-helix transcriptional regulator [Anaerolineales bacterium]
MDNNANNDYWLRFPATFRAEAMTPICHWLSGGESGLIVGGSGVGKSNLVNFILNRPDVIARYIPRQPERYCFVLLDMNALPALTLPFFYRALFQALVDTAELLDGDLFRGMQALNASPIKWDDPFTVLTLLQKAHRLFIRQGGKKVVWLLDRFDEACRSLDAQALNSLRALRDQFKGDLIYLLFTRQPLARLRSLSEIDEFYEIVTANTCWLGPMVEADSRWMVEYLAGRQESVFAEPAVSQLIAISGGLPAFLKGACLVLAQNELGLEQSSQEWVCRLLPRPEFQRNCQEIWCDLTSGEQHALSALQTRGDTARLDRDTIDNLQNTGLLDQDKRIFLPIFAAYVAQQRGGAAGLIELHPKTRAVLRGGITLNVELTPSEDRLLSFLLEHPGEVCQKDTLIYAVWPNDHLAVGISDERLAQLVKRLRDKIEPNPTDPLYIQTVRGRGYRLVQPGES